MPPHGFVLIIFTLSSPLDKHFLGASCVPDPGLDTGATEVGRGDQASALWSFHRGGLSVAAARG